ncbi:hypothetical protein BJ741DRAFT_620259 [Chytriomyces cf. hyalinus JEL632]|nr:hypothetical protein BJ741DRAFT_620259 [Chytriomyces cf. hyalinus JEL632]
MTSQLPVPNWTQAYLAANDFPIDIVSSDARGRYAIAARDIREGDVVLRAQGYAAVCTQVCRKEVCSGCFQAYSLGVLGLKCDACSMAFYCTLECREKSFDLHSRFECMVMSQIAGMAAGKAFEKAMGDIDAVLGVQDNGAAPCRHMQDLERTGVQSLARWLLGVCVRGLIEEGGLIPTGTLPTYNSVLELVPNDDCLPQDERLKLEGLYIFFSNLTSKPGKKTRKKADPSLTTTTLKSLSQFMTSTMTPVQVSFSELFTARFPEPIDFIRIICIRQCNVFGLWDAESECLGQSFFPAASYFNHSCDKNLYFDQTMKLVPSSEANKPNSSDQELAREMESMDLNSVKVEDDVEASNTRVFAAVLRMPVLVFQAKRDISKGEALTHCYVDQSLEREERRAALKEEYYFDCDCDRCVREDNQIGKDGSMDGK